MIQIQALANTIEEELNGTLNAIAFDQHFKIHATVGEYKKATTITAHYLQATENGGNFATKATLESATTFYYKHETIVPKNYDYAVVTADETHQNKTTEYTYQDGDWVFNKILTQTEIDKLAENVGAKRSYINGVLRSSAGTFTPVKHVNNVLATIMLELAVPQEDVHEIEQTITSWEEDVIGEVYSMGNWNLLITPQPPTPSNARINSPLGEFIPYLIVLEYQMIENGIISNAVKWTINEQEVDATNAQITFNRNPDVIPLANQGENVANNQYETTAVSMVLAYKTTNIIKTLVNDLINHRKDQVYVISRDDGFADTYSGNFILTKGDIIEESGKIVALSLAFSPSQDQPVETE